MSRLLVLTNLYPSERTPWGGSFITSRVHAMVSQGHDVDVLALVPARSRAMRLLLRAAGRTSRPHDAHLTAPFSGVEIPMGSWEFIRAWRGAMPRRAVRRGAARVRASVDLRDYDAVIAHGMYMLPAGAVARELVGSNRYAVVCHGSDINFLMPKRARAYVETLDDAKCAVFVSRALMENARSHGISHQTGTVISNGVDPDQFHPGRRTAARARWGWAEEQVLAFVGNLERVKGADRIPEIGRHLAELNPKARLVIAGDGALAEELKAKARSNMTFLGRLGSDEVADLMAGADGVVLPSRNEGWPTVILEAYASGTPVVGTDVGGIREALDTEQALVPEGGDVARNLVEAIHRIWQGPSPAGHLREVAVNCSWDAVASREVEASLK